MAIKKYGPTTPGRRGMTVTDYSVLSKVAPERSLLEPMKKHSGRNNTGRMAVGQDILYLIGDDGVEAAAEGIEFYQF